MGPPEGLQQAIPPRSQALPQPGGSPGGSSRRTVVAKRSRGSSARSSSGGGGAGGSDRPNRLASLDLGSRSRQAAARRSDGDSRRSDGDFSHPRPRTRRGARAGPGGSHRSAFGLGPVKKDSQSAEERSRDLEAHRRRFPKPRGRFEAPKGVEAPPGGGPARECRQESPQWALGPQRVPS